MNSKIMIKLRDLMLKHSETMMLIKNQIEAELRKKLRNMNNFNLITQKLTRIEYNE